MFSVLLILSVRAIALTGSDKQQIDFSRQNFGERAGLRVTAWRNLINSIQTLSEQQKLNKINDFFNQLVFIDDIKLWGQNDYWATPIQFLDVGGGDCEDFSIAKYSSLRELGIADSKLHLIYVKSLTLNQFHMVVAYYQTPSSMPVILDNIDGEIKPANQRQDLVPIYSFNASKLWITKKRERSINSIVAGDASNLSLWKDLQQRSKKQNTKHPIINLDQ
ncbi:transglutaminase-like cysteine peptidase [Vibrio algicola]|uniref:transglutaminase-like cysteine peptidase n=1 Tax=Vibrio algicola TaxID=2662262 RepID=UPI001C49E9F4|nr:transglutaminase-like cysteine peptidase [Vibrio algicola]